MGLSQKMRVAPFRSSGALLPPSPPAEKATARQDRAGQASTGDGARDGNRCGLRHLDVTCLGQSYFSVARDLEMYGIYFGPRHCAVIGDILLAIVLAVRMATHATIPSPRLSI